MTYLNIEDARFLFGALIQLLPMVLSITLIALFAYRPERGLFKEFAGYIVALVIFVLIVLFIDVLILARLTYDIQGDCGLPVFGIILSMVALGSLFVFVIAYLYKVDKLAGQLQTNKGKK